MKIGVLLSRFPYPLEKGDKLRAYHQIKYLSKKHEIYLCALSDKKVSESDFLEVKKYCTEIKIVRLSKLSILLNLAYSFLFSKLPLQVAYFYQRNSKASIHDFFIKNKIDHLFCQLIRVAEYAKGLNFPKTIDYMDALSRGMERRIDKAAFYLKPFIAMEASRLKGYEHFIFQHFNHATIISEQDQHLIVHAQNHNIRIIPNGVDQEYFEPRKSEKKFDLLFTGNMSYPPNVDGVTYLVNEVLPLVWEKIPKVNLVIAGANPSNKVLKLAEKRVKITGWVDDIRDYYAQSKIFIAPMQIGTGLQNKLLEAMAMKLPCITSPLANNALDAVDRESILIGNSPNEYSELILELLSKPNLSNSIAVKGNEFISNHYDWNATTNQLEKLFLDDEGIASTD